MNHRDWCIDFKIFVKIYKVHYIFGFKVAIWWVPIWFEKYSIQYFAWKIRNIKIIIIIIRRENIYHTFLTRVQNSGSNKLYGILSLSLSLSSHQPSLILHLQIASMNDSCESLIEFIVPVFFPYLFSQHHWQWHVPFDPSIHLCKLRLRLALA